MTEHNGLPDGDRPEPSQHPDPAHPQNPPRPNILYLIIPILAVAVMWLWIKHWDEPTDDPTPSPPTPTTALPPTPTPGQSPSGPALPTSTWAKTYGGQDAELAQALALADDGSVFIAGYAFSINGEPDALLAKIAPDGALLWTQTYGGTKDDWFSAVALADDGSIIAAGHTRSSDGDIPAKQGDQDTLLAKIAPDGSLIWARAYGGTGIDEFNAVALDDDGNILVAGRTDSVNSNLYINGYDAVRYVGHNALLAKIAPDGTPIWGQICGGGGDDTFTSLAITADGDILAAGATTSDDKDIATNRGKTDALLAKTAPDGALLWTQTYGGSGDDVFQALAIADDGDILAAGYTRSFDGDITTNRSGRDVLLAKIAPDGALIWTNTNGGTGWDGLAALAITADGDIIATGYTTSTDGDLPPNRGGGDKNDDALLIKVAPDGALIWTKTHGGTGNDSFEALAIAADGNIIATGLTHSNDGDLPPSRGGADGLLVKFPPNS